MRAPLRVKTTGAIRLAALLAVPSLVVAALLVAVIRPRLDEQAREGFVRRAESLAQVFANAVEPGVEFEDDDHVRNVLALLASAGDVAYASVWLTPERPFAVWTAGGVTARADRPTRHLAHEGGILRVTDAIETEDVSGVLELAVPLVALEAQLRSNALIANGSAAVVIVIGGAFACLAAVFLRRRRRAEDALRRSESSFRQMIERSPDGLVVHDGGAIVYANAAVCRLLGREDLRGTRAIDLVHPEDRPSVTALQAELGSAATAAPLRERRFLREDGGTVVAEVTALAVTFEGTPSILEVIRDVTERRNLQERLLLADRMASVGTLAAGVAHEINNPLTYVLGNLGFARGELQRALKGTPLDLEELLNVLTEAHDGGEQVRAIVRDLKTFSRDDHETREAVDVHKILDSALNVAMNEIKHRAVLKKEYGAIPDVLANESRLGQVFLNLLVNAAQAIPSGAMDRHSIRIRTITDGAHSVTVEISDTGAGIPQSVLSRIFDPFFTTKPVGVGTGLGLSICHAIVRSLGGDITVESRVGEGTTFRVRMPIATELVAAPAPSPVGRTAAPASGKILIVDDEPSVASAIGRLLHGHDVEVMTDSRAALERLTSAPGRYDAILCDLMMPSLSGMELYDALARQAPAVVDRIVFITGGAFTESAAAFLQRVPNDRLQKPLSATQLADALSPLL
jgi:two-component system, cell cycle sensor histidine kinase and response regulator CckA